MEKKGMAEKEERGLTPTTGRKGSSVFSDFSLSALTDRKR
jgi:hypothetical protein